MMNSSRAFESRNTRMRGLLSLLSLVTVFWISLPAADYVTSDGLRFQIYSGKEAYLVGPESPQTYSGDIVIPEKIAWGSDSVPVTKLEKDCISGQTGITSLIIPGSVAEIGENSLKDVVLENFILKDGSKVLKGTCASGLFRNGKIERLYIGRNISMSGGQFFRYTEIGKVEWSAEIRVVPANLLLAVSMSDTGGSKFEIGEGILEIEKGALHFSRVDTIVLPPTVISLSKGWLNFPFRDDAAAVTVWCGMKVPQKLSDELIATSGMRAGKITVPHGSGKYYEYCGWDRYFASAIEESGDSPVVSPEEPEYITVTVGGKSDDTVINCHPRYRILKGNEFTVELEVDKGWKIVSASLSGEGDGDLEPAPEGVMRRAESDVVVISPAPGGKLYRLQIPAQEKDARVSYVLAKETPVGVEEVSQPGNAPVARVTQGYGVVVTGLDADADVVVCDMDGRKVAGVHADRDGEARIRLPERGLYLIRAGARAFKVYY